MIHVDHQPEPPGFDEAVRQRGLNWLRDNNIPLDTPPPDKTTFPPHWRDCLDDLHRLYGQTCAYLAIRFPRLTGASVDHFVAKSQNAGQAYEWDNFRLACSTMNSRKNDYDDVLDPFEVENGWFHLELVFGGIFPNPDLPPQIQETIDDTITRLGLDDEECRKIRVDHLDEFRNGHCDADWLRRWSPLVWHEARRQGVLA